MVGRSALGAVSVYNLLPQEIVDADSVKGFQHSLQDLAKNMAAQHVPAWKHLLSIRYLMHTHPLKRINHELESALVFVSLDTHCCESIKAVCCARCSVIITLV